MTENLSSIRERIHRKSHAYFVFEYGRRERKKWRMFYGAMDALLDAGTAAASYGPAVTSNEHVKLLACYGFLQALYVQQDAIQILWRALGVKWNPNCDERLKEIRAARNRLTGHPAFADTSRSCSSAIIPYHGINERGFRGHVYYDDGTEDNLEVEVSSFRQDNEERLAVQLREIERKMDEEEQNFRTKHAARPLSSHLVNGFSYLMQRLHCDLGDAGRVPQAQTHAQMIREVIKRLHEDMTERGFASSATAFHIDRIITGLDLLNNIMTKGSSAMTTQHEFDLICDGVEKQVGDIQSIIGEIDAKLLTSVG